MRAFLSMIAPSMTELLADAQGRAAQSLILGVAVSVFEDVDSHDVAIPDRDVFGDSSPDADHRILDHRAAADRPFRRRSGCFSPWRRRCVSRAGTAAW